MDYKQTLYGALSKTAARVPENHALLFMGKYVSYRELLEKVDALAAGFIDLEISQGDVVTLAMPNVFEAIFAFYALNKLGVICHMVHPLTPVVQMSKFMKQTGSKLLLIVDTFFSHFEPLLEEKDKRFVLVTPVDEFGGLKRFGYRLLNRKRLTSIVYDERVIPLRDLYKKTKVETAKVSPEATAFLLHSGGTSGEPKTIELSNAAINYLGSTLPFILELEQLTDVHMLAVLPMFHGFGLCMGIHGMLMAGGVDTLMPKFDADLAVKLIGKDQINVVIGVPSLFESLLRQKDFDTDNVRNLYQAYVGGDYVAQDLKNRFNAVMRRHQANALLNEGYGLTEAVTVTCVNTNTLNKEGTVGKPLPGIDMQILNPGEMTFLGPDQSGEIIVSGPTLMNGYLGDKKATKETMIQIEGKTWVRTGDLGLIDGEGFVHFKQRVKRIIKVSGMPVLPAEIENFLMDLPEVKEVAAIGVPDPLKGSKVRLFIAWNAGVTPLTLEKIQNLIKENIGRYAEPDEIVVMDELPKTIIGKINVLELEKMA